jgi:hypothetical protein
MVTEEQLARVQDEASKIAAAGGATGLSRPTVDACLKAAEDSGNGINGTKAPLQVVL